MKTYLPYCLTILGAVAVVYFMRMGRPGPGHANRARGVVAEAEAPADRLPPAPIGNAGAFVNTDRLRKLAASNYKGPNYAENYDTPEIIMAAKTRVTGRLPASNTSTGGDAPASKPADGAAEGTNH